MTIFITAFAWFFSSLLRPWFLVVIGVGFGLFTDLGNWFLFKLASWALDHARDFIQWLDASGFMPHLSFSAIPSDYLVLIGYLNIAECLGIILSAYAIRFTRMRLFR